MSKENDITKKMISLFNLSFSPNHEGIFEEFGVSEFPCLKFSFYPSNLSRTKLALPRGVTKAALKDNPFCHTLLLSIYSLLFLHFTHPFFLSSLPSIQWSLKLLRPISALSNAPRLQPSLLLPLLSSPPLLIISITLHTLLLVFLR